MRLRTVASRCTALHFPFFLFLRFVYSPITFGSHLIHFFLSLFPLDDHDLLISNFICSPSLSLSLLFVFVTFQTFWYRRYEVLLQLFLVYLTNGKVLFAFATLFFSQYSPRSILQFWYFSFSRLIANQFSEHYLILWILDDGQCHFSVVTIVFRASEVNLSFCVNL